MTHAPATAFLTEPMRAGSSWPSPGRAPSGHRGCRSAGGGAYTSGVSGMSACRRRCQERRPWLISSISADGGTASTGQRACARQYRLTERCSTRPNPGPAPGPDDEQVVRLVGGLDQHRAWLAPDRLRFDLQVGGHAAQAGVERGPQPLPGGVAPDLAQVGPRDARRSAISPPGRNPRGDGQQRHVPLPGLVRRVPQRLQAPERPMHANNDPTHRGHGNSPPD